MGKFFLLFAALPLVDMYLLVRIGRAFGGWIPLVLVLVSGVLGAILIRTAGLRVIDAWRRALAQGTAPSDSVFSGVLMLFGCALFIMPGLISDALGAALMIPAVRRRVALAVGKRLFDAMQNGSMRVVQVQSPFAQPSVATRRQFIDVEAEVIEEKPASTDDLPPQLKS
ncbi:MAG TPA: FxsA family protein [Polyangiales bacterium]|nr:FxsA family protein [Polyangiales bacterium]